MRHELAVPEVTFELIFPTLGTMCIYFYFSQHLQYMYIFAKNFYSIKLELYLLVHMYPANYVRMHFRQLGVYKESRVATEPFGG